MAAPVSIPRTTFHFGRRVGEPDHGTHIGWRGRGHPLRHRRCDRIFFGDILFGNQLANRLRGGGGNDRINGRGGPDALRGQRGTRDKVAFVGAPSGVTVSLQGGSAGGWGADSLTGFEEVIGSTHSDRITGDHLSNELDGGGGNDNIRGLGGADRLLGRGGQDTLNGGDGPDTLVGDAAHDVLDGGAGDDRLFGADGPDLLHGNVGNDALNGGAGTDTCHQDAGSGPETSCEKPTLAPSGGGGAASAAARRAIRLASRQVQTSIALAGVGTDRGARSRASRTM